MDTTTQLPFTRASFQRYLNEHKLMGTRCTTCGDQHLPPRAVCPNCLSTALEWTEMIGQGRLAAFTAVSICPSFMAEQGFGRDNPYIAGIVDLDNGLKISALILALDAKKPDSIQNGIPVEIDFVDTGEGENKKVSLAFRPA
jgi:uncharacterized protein